MEILSVYRDFKNFEPKYNKWYQNQESKDAKTAVILNKKPVTDDVLYEQKRAKIITDALTTIDEYAQTKAEDIDSVSQTLLYVSVGALGAIGTFFGKSLSKNVSSPKLAKTLPSAMGVGFALATFLPVVRSTVFNQVRAVRIARFEGMHDKLFHVNNFAVLDDEQKNEALKNAKNIPDKIVNPKESIIHRSNIFNSFSVFKDLTMKQGEFLYLKKQLDKKLNEDEKNVKEVKFSNEELAQAKKDKKLFNDVLKKVDIESHYPIERIEKAVNVAYSSMFVGGVLEYLVSDGILNLLNVKNKIIRPVLSWGLPVLTIMFLNKQLANFLYDAIKAIRYKKMQEFVNDKNNFKEYNEDEIKDAKAATLKNKNTGFIDFFKATMKDIKDYKNYQKNKRPEEKKYSLGVRNITLTTKQKSDAELFKRNMEMTINTLDDQTQKYAMATETLTESTTIPIDIIAPIIGTFAADKLHKSFSPSGKYRNLFKGIGAILAFLPAAMSEIYFVGQQRSAWRSATLIASDNLQNPDKFLDPNKKMQNNGSTLKNWNFNSGKKFAFQTFKKTNS